MKLLLLDLDRTKFGNLALMKLSAWHKSRGDEVFFGQSASWDRCYVSCVFTSNAKKNTYPPDAVLGGSGFGMKNWLPLEAEHSMPDYSLYNLHYSMGFTSRGCPRKCPWCMVPEKEGNILPWTSIYEFWDRRHDSIMLLDNNILASPKWHFEDTLLELAKQRLKVDFNQGLDIRLVDDEKAWWLSTIRLWKGLRFSFDMPSMAEVVKKGVSLLKSRGSQPHQLSFYVLVGYNTTFDEDKERFSLLRELGCDAFPMFYTDREGVEHLPARGHIREREMPHGSRWAIRKYLRLTNRIEGRST